MFFMWKIRSCCDSLPESFPLMQPGWRVEKTPGGGGGVPSRISVMLVEETKAGDTSRPECPCDDQERQPLAGLNGLRGGAVSEGDTRSPCGGGGEAALFRFFRGVPSG